VPYGVGEFCSGHLKRAKKLRQLQTVEAVELLKADADLRRGPLAWFRRLFSNAPG
jgi:hypothetical protein